MKYKELKEFCNKLSDEQLDKPVIVWREDESINKIDPTILEEDYYMVPDQDEACYPLSEASEEDKPNLKKVYEKGTPILWEEF